MTRVSIAAASGSYDAVIENGLINCAGGQLRQVLGGASRLFVLSVPPVRRRWGRTLMSSLSAAGFEAKLLGLPDGETSKKLRTVELLGEKLVALGADRDSALVALGGGVVGDIAGFVASIYMRGLPVVQIPTTVLAQVDAAIGGKTGVNLRAGKNLIGTFHQPRLVLIDPAVLSTLPEREFRAGLYEALKCGVIGKPELFAQLESVDFQKLRKDPAGIESVIAQSVRLKAEVVSADERESGLRRVLNLGHTIAHALETESAYRRFLHGEAVAWGLIAETRIAQMQGVCEPDTAQRIIQAILGLGRLPKVTATSRSILRLLQSDKKTRGGAVHFVVPKQIGQVEVVSDVPEKVVVTAVDELRQMSKSS